jgi:hypothetical protein
LTPGSTSLVPDIFDQQLAGHIKSYNLALPALGIEPAYFVLKDLIQRHECPTYVITPIITNDGKTASLFDYYGVQGMSFPGEFLSYLVNRQDKTVLFNYISPMRLYTHELMKYVMNFIIRRSNIAETQTKNEGILQQMFSDRGYYYIREQALYPNGRLPADYGIDPHADLRPIKAVHFDFDNDPYVKKFFDLAEKNHIHVLLINLVARQGTQAPYLECPDMYSIIASRYRNVVLTSTSWQRKFMPNDYFSDDVHLNPEGACLFTKMIAKEFSLAFRF